MAIAFSPQEVYVKRYAFYILIGIDWDQAARELRMDYASVEYDGVTHWYR